LPDNILFDSKPDQMNRSEKPYSGIVLEWRFE